MHSYSGEDWGKEFVSTFVQFIYNATSRYAEPMMPVFVGQGNMDNSDLLYNLLMSVVSDVNAAGGNAHYLDMRVAHIDGCGGHPGVEGN